MTGQGIRLVATLPEVSRIIRTPLGDVPIRDGGNDMSYVSGDRLVTVPAGTELFFGEDGRVRSVLPGHAASGGDRAWFFSEDFGANAKDDAFRDEVGAVVWPLPFAASRVHPFRPGGYILRRDGRDVICYVTSGRVLAAPLSRESNLDYVWASADGRRIAMLVRKPAPEGGSYRRLLVDDEVAFEGRFSMGRNGFSWSPDGSHFVARLALVGPDGAQGKEMLVTRGEPVAIPERSAAHEPLVDDAGRLAYVYADHRGRRVVVDGIATEAFPYAWNLSVGRDGTVAANVLSRGQIRRIELIGGR